ncbi:MAG: tyrosine-type recombinase/integrase [Actinomycetota bacterium]|nr:tyrosine-type recombinase/integrase [Actinomycetota bacterium]
MTWDAWIAQWGAHMRAAGARPGTVALRTYQLERCALEIGGTPAGVTGDVLTEWMGSRGWSRGTLRSFRAALRSFYGWAETTGRVASSPAGNLPSPGVPPPNPRPTPEVAYRHALTHADERVRLMIRLAAELGLRRAEVAAVHARDVEPDLVGYSLRVDGKGGKVRMVPMPEDLARAVLRRAAGGYAFPGDDGGHLSPRWVGRLVSRLMPEGWSMHSLRHRAATRWYAIDRDLLTTQQLLGHSSPATTQAYVVPPDDARRRLVLAAAS